MQGLVSVCPPAPCYDPGTSSVNQSFGLNSDAPELQLRDREAESAVDRDFHLQRSIFPNSSHVMGPTTHSHVLDPAPLLPPAGSPQLSFLLPSQWILHPSFLPQLSFLLPSQIHGARWPFSFLLHPRRGGGGHESRARRGGSGRGEIRPRHAGGGGGVAAAGRHNDAAAGRPGGAAVGFCFFSFFFLFYFFIENIFLCKIFFVEIFLICSYNFFLLKVPCFLIFFSKNFLLSNFFLWFSILNFFL